MIQRSLFPAHGGELARGCLTLLALLCCWDIASRLDDDPGDGRSASPASLVSTQYGVNPQGVTTGRIASYRLDPRSR